MTSIFVNLKGYESVYKNDFIQIHKTWFDFGVMFKYKLEVVVTVSILCGNSYIVRDKGQVAAEKYVYNLNKTIMYDYKTNEVDTWPAGANPAF